MSGEMTAVLGRRLAQALAPFGLDVLYDHGQGEEEAVGKPTLWFGSDYGRPTRLGAVDIAVVERERDRALVLFEIEESTADPKRLLGDVFATLFSEHLTMPAQNHRRLIAGQHTTLAVLAKIRGPQYRPRLHFLQERIDQLGPFGLRRVILESFVDAEELERKVGDILREHAITDGN